MIPGSCNCLQLIVQGANFNSSEPCMQEFAELKGMMAELAEVRQHKASFAAALREAKRNIPEADQVGSATARFKSAADMVMAAVKCSLPSSLYLTLLCLSCGVLCLSSTVVVLLCVELYSASWVLHVCGIWHCLDSVLLCVRNVCLMERSIEHRFSPRAGMCAIHACIGIVQ